MKIELHYPNVSSAGHLSNPVLSQVYMKLSIGRLVGQISQTIHMYLKYMTGWMRAI